MVKAVIFDLDGVIILTEHLTSRYYDTLLRSMGKTPIPYPNGMIQPVGLRGKETWAIFKERYNITEDTEPYREKMRGFYAQSLKENMHPMPGLLELLKYIKKHNLKMAIATGSSPEIAELVTKGLGIESYFEAIVSGRDVKETKPHPEPYLLASQKIKINPSDCLAIEDSAMGIMSAKKAGMFVVALSNGLNEGEDHSNANLVVKSLMDPNLLKAISGA